MQKLAKPFAGKSGFTFIENIIAVSIIAIGFTALHAVASQCMRLMSAAREQMTAGQALQDRTDTLRACSWVQVTDSAYLAANVMNSAANTAPLMSKITETVTINSYPTAATTPIQLTRSSSGAVTVVSTNSTIANGDLVSITVQMAWTSWLGNRAHTETINTVFAENTR
jgi:prepilin-type N-terminal cleavage/methylation domain-containing protein